MAAEDIQIRSSTGRARLRSPVWVGVFSFITLYIYAAVWWYRINREMRDLGRARGTTELGESPGTSLLAVTLGALVILPPFFSMYGTGKRIQAAQRIDNGVVTLNGWLAVVMALLFAPVLFAYFQSELNKVWEAERAPGPEVLSGAAPALDGQSGLGARPEAPAGP